MSNVSMRFTDVVSIKEYGKYNDEGKYKINEKNQYMINIVKQALQRTIGTCEVFSKEYCNKTKLYTACECELITFVDDKGNEKTIESYKRPYEPNSNTIGDTPFLNLVQLVNIVLDDRQLSYFTNKLNQPCIKVISSKHKNTLYYVRDKNTNQSERVNNPISESTIDVATKQGLKQVSDNEKKKIRDVLDLCGLLYYCKPLAKKVDKNKK